MVDGFEGVAPRDLDRRLNWQALVASRDGGQYPAARDRQEKVALRGVAGMKFDPQPGAQLLPVAAGSPPSHATA